MRPHDDQPAGGTFAVLALPSVQFVALGLVMLYRFDRPPDYDLHGPDRPAAPCDGDVSHR